MSFLRSVVDLLLPAACSFCSSPIGDSPIPRFCSTCWNDFALVQGPVCPSCGMPFVSPEALRYSPEQTCLPCRTSNPAYDQALSVGQFEGSLREAIHQFKYRPCRALGKPLGTWLAQHVHLRERIDLIVPVPLHTKRLRQRGFNQSVLLAHQVSMKCKAPLVSDNLLRVRPTQPQVELPAQERVKNVAGAFTVLRPREVEGNHILLIDDVFTTGATINECARVLKTAGSARVSALTLARPCEH